MRLLAVCLSLLAFAARPVADAGAQDYPATRAEASGYTETARYDEAVEFLDLLDRRDPRMHRTHFGYSVEGRALPLVVYGDVSGPSAGEVRASGRLRVFVMANIHGGEVCGKDAMLAFLRDLAASGRPAWADSLVLLVAPIYNADGNERFSLYNRPRQHGPIGGMGRRENARDLDLNRDHMKLASPEARSLVGLLDDYDPHIVVDLHTTNGSRHGYHLTYAAPMHPATDPAIVDLARGELLETVTAAVKDRTGWDTYYYGNLPFRSGSPGWYTFDHRPRFNTNYVGLRNRVGILSEAYAYAPFRERVLVTRAFVEEILDFAHTNAWRVRAATRAADEREVAGTALGLRARVVASARPADIILGEVRSIRHPYTGETMFEMTDERRVESMPEYGTFEATEAETAPVEYLVPKSLRRVIDLLHDHGVRTQPATGDGSGLQAFLVDSVRVADRPFQGVNEHEVVGRWAGSPEAFDPSAWESVPVSQALGRLVVSLLEPRADDGIANWAIVGGADLDGGRFPILRRIAAVRR